VGTSNFCRGGEPAIRERVAGWIRYTARKSFTPVVKPVAESFALARIRRRIVRAVHRRAKACPLRQIYLLKYGERVVDQENISY